MAVLGFIAGIVMALGFALAITMWLVKSSNALGDSKGSYQQFTGGEMHFIRKK